MVIAGLRFMIYKKNRPKAVASMKAKAFQPKPTAKPHDRA